MTRMRWFDSYAFYRPQASHEPRCWCIAHKTYALDTETVEQPEIPELVPTQSKYNHDAVKQQRYPKVTSRQ